MNLVTNYIQEELERARRIKKKCDLLGMKYPDFVKVYTDLEENGGIRELIKACEILSRREQAKLISRIETTIIEIFIRYSCIIEIMTDFVGGNYKSIFYNINFAELRDAIR